MGRIIRDLPKLYTPESPVLLIIALDELCPMLATETNAYIRDVNGLQYSMPPSSKCLYFFLCVCDFIVLCTKVAKDPPESTYTHACFHTCLLEFLSTFFKSS